MRVDKELISPRRRKRAIQVERIACAMMPRQAKLGIFKDMDEGQECRSLGPAWFMMGYLSSEKP